jgi:hypothetical protein
MSWFNREELKIALNTARVSIDEETISHLDVWLYVLTQVYALPARRQHLPPGWRVLKVEEANGPSKELKKLDKALRDWIYSEYKSKEREMDIIQGFNVTGFPFYFSLLSVAISHAISWEENAAAGNIKRKEAIETSVLIDLYKKYSELSGKRGLSDEGPALRFIKKCTSILGMEVRQQGLRRRIQQAILARQKKATYGPRPRDLLALLETISFFSGGVVIRAMPEPPELVD